MKTSLVVAVLSLAGLVACAPAPTPSYRYEPSGYMPPPKSDLEMGAPFALTPQMQQIVRAGVAKGMKDPDGSPESGRRA